MRSTIDIHSKGEYPVCALSNFAEHEFYIDNVKCSSMEGFLQSLKFKSGKKQRQVCLLSGKEAKNSTKYTFAQLRWKITHNLYWQGKRINRFSDEYQILLDRAYEELSKNIGFQRVLKDSLPYTLTHSIGKVDTRKTVLTEYEFISRLERTRGQLMREELKCKVYDKNTFDDLKYVVVCSLYEDKLLLSRHKERDTWETQGGHIEDGETPLQAAKRELYEESGVTDAELIYLCDYLGYTSKGHANGAVFLAIVNELAELPESEMAEVKLFDLLPDNLTYPFVTPLIIKRTLEQYRKECILKELSKQKDTCSDDSDN